MKDCTFDNVEKSNVLVGVENLVLENVKINGELVDTPAKQCTTVDSSEPR
jgi:hypothetical protein